MSQLLIRLERELASMTDPIKKAEWAARIAANLARLGSFDEAQSTIINLRQVYGDGRSGPVTAWIMLAEGLIHLYKDLSPVALDRIARAQLLGVAMGYTSFVGVASAWKAHIEFEMSKFPAMVDSLKAAIKSAAAEDHDAQTRIAMVITNCFMLCGNFANAQLWFMRGRDHAVKNGDQASIEALLYNRAAFSLSWLRLRHCDVAAQPEELQRTRAEVKSSRNLQDLTQISALTNHIQLADARLLILEGEYREAIAKLRAVRDSKPFASHNFSQSLVDLEICYCQFGQGDIEGALLTYRALDHSTLSTLDLDEQIVAEWMKLKISQADARFGSWVDHRLSLDSLQAKHRRFATDLGDSLEQLQTS